MFAKNKSVDIESLYSAERHEKGAAMQVKDEFGNLLDMFLIIAGPDSKAWRQAVSKNKFNLASDEDTNDVKIELMVEITLGWKGFTQKGKALEFSKDKVRNLYKQAPYLLTQIDEFFANRANFTQG